ncbi:MAG: SpvB/TcaC N-terminal domain-containing protein, partial [Sulfurifustaceae bacterium]
MKAGAGGGYQTVAGLENLNLTLLPAGWNTFNVATPIATAKLQFVLTPATGGSATGLKEIEVWTTAAPTSVKSGAALLDKMLGPTPLPQGRLYTALNPTANPTVGVITPSGDDTSDNTFTFTLDRDPSHFLRAYLTYELYGQQHWVSVSRVINSGFDSTAGGTLILPATTWSTQVERINPSWLKKGANTIKFSVLSSSSKDSGYTVRNVRVLAELDTGANIVETITPNEPDATGTNPIDALYDGDIATGWKPYPSDQPINAATPSVELGFRRPAQMDAVSFYLSAPLDGQYQLSIKQAGQWSDYPAERASTLSTGWNTIYPPSNTTLDQRLVEGIRLSFSGGSSNTAEIRELMFVGSAVGGRSVPPKVFVTYPDNEQFYGRRAHFRGFIDPSNNGSGEAQLYVGGTTESQVGGTFDTWRSKDQVGLGTLADNDAWSVEVKAVYPNGETVTTTVPLTKQMSQATPATGALAGSGTGTFFNKKKSSVTVDEAKLAADAGTVATDTTITVTPLDDSNTPALDVGMMNVTKGPRRGYRFLPHGAKFLKNVTVTLPYDKALIPPGHTEDDIKTFYFDDQAGRWVALDRVGVDKTNKLVNSLTNHFTDMINAVVTVPDHPDAVSFNPTSMKDIKAADPGSQVNLIEPPKGNNMGDARVSYPIEVPPGRAGLQPQLAVQYNSSGGNGWMGLGWDLSQQSITVDTRWGVPRYGRNEQNVYVNKETETYVFNGEQLTPVAHRGELVDRIAEKIFHTRVEGQFRKIIRHGNHPTNYWWEVIDKNGVRYFCGGTPELGRLDGATLTDGDGNVFKWFVTEVRDLNGNRMTYAYDKVSDVGVAQGTVPGFQLYLRNINYTGSSAA